MSKIKPREKFDLPSIFSSILTEIIAQDPQQTFFLPVDTKVFFDYTKKISKPMDLQTMQRKLKKYQGYKEFESDLNLIWSNCRIYNQENSDIYKTSLRMEKFSKKCLKEHLTPYRSLYKFDEKGTPIKKRKYKRTKECSPSPDSLNGTASVKKYSDKNYSSAQKQSQNYLADTDSFSVAKERSNEERRGSFQAAKLGKYILKQRKSGSNKMEMAKKSFSIDKKVLTNYQPTKSHAQNCIVIGLQQQIISKENIISEEEKQFLRDKVANFSQEELFKCIKTIQEYEPHHITQHSKELYVVNFNTLTKMTFNKIREQFFI